MGYSCSAKANYTLDAIAKLIDGPTSNGTPDGGFYEVGRENADGAITGSVFKPYAPDPTKCVKRGGFKIGANGKVVKFPGLPSKMLREAEATGAATYAANYGSWRERAAAFLPGLESGAIMGKLSYSWFESIFKEWQNENGFMFAVMPAATNDAMAAAISGMLKGETK